MKDNKILKFIFEYEKKVFIILFAIFTIGFICGGYYFFIEPDLTDITLSLQPSEIFNKLFIFNFWLFTITFLSGYNVIAFPFLFCLVIINGINAGVFLNSFTYTNGFKTTILYCILLLPFLIILILSHFYITFSSLRLSASLYTVFKEGTRYISPKVYSKPHILKFILFFILMLISLALYSFIFMPILLKIL